MSAIRKNIKNGTFRQFHDKYINKLWYLRLIK
jgi:hypothetical protein